MWSLSDLSKRATERTNDSKWYSHLSISNHGLRSIQLEQSIFCNSGGLLQQILGDKIVRHKINKISQEDEENFFKTWNIWNTSGNAPQYTAQVFNEFSKEWNFKHVTSSPEYSKSNGFVERHIQVVKDLLTKAKQSGKDPDLAMLESRNCLVENSSSPAQLIYGRCLRSLSSIYQEKLK